MLLNRLSRLRLSWQRSFTSITCRPSQPLPADDYVPSFPVRTRFAPSPTGDLHLGSLRTALFNYLLAKRTAGQFILRIEDTDSKRTVEGAEEKLLRDLRWAGIHWDEGPEVGGKYGPYRQSERSNLYQEHAEKLAKSGHAFRCFCSPETLRDVAEANSKLGLGSEYNGACLSIPIEESSSRAASGEPHVVRLKDWRRSSQKRLQWEDVLRGQVSMSARKRHKDDQMDDAVLLKSDGLPTYHLANVVDDHFMKITHVIRGNEWFTSTWKHICLYEAFGWTPPKFAHVGLLLDSEGKKLSKRDKTFGLEEVRDAILPETMANFLALLGWHHGHDGSEYFTMADLENEFNLRLNTNNPTVSLRKLSYLQKRHANARVESGGDLYDDLIERTQKAVSRVYTKEDLASVGLRTDRDLRSRVDQMFKAGIIWENAALFATRHAYFFRLPLQSPQETVPRMLKTLLSDLQFKQSLEEMIRTQMLSHIIQFEKDPESMTPSALAGAVEATSHAAAKAIREAQLAFPASPQPGHEENYANKLARGCVMHFLRVWISGGQGGPSMDVTMAILGPHVCRQRLRSKRPPIET